MVPSTTCPEPNDLSQRENQAKINLFREFLLMGEIQQFKVEQAGKREWSMPIAEMSLNSVLSILLYKCF